MTSPAPNRNDAERALAVNTTVAVAQFAPTANEAANLDAIMRMTADAAHAGAHVVIFPEYASYFVNPFDESLAAHAQPRDGVFVARLAELARQHEVTIVAGMAEISPEPGTVYNTVVAVGAAGIVASYRKIHLYDAFGARESDWVAAGPVSAPETFEVAGIRFALMTCYDLRFPEIARTLTDTGAHVLVVPAEWVTGPLKAHHWTTLVHARAIENTVYVAAADHPPPIGVGLSRIVSPEGIDLASIDTATAIATSVVDVGEVTRVREKNPALALRRFRVEPR